MGKTTIFEVAKAFLSLEAMTHKKLQKLCYYAYSWHLTLQGERLFRNNFEAWIHGPVDPGLYSEYKHFGWQTIPQEDQSPIEGELMEFIQEVYDSYGHLDGDELEFLTHKEDPWMEARGSIPEYVPCNNRIKDEVIKDYYLKELENGQIE
ncbi:Panacea domain-containing protein [Effusibacillus consociatus]|uniref:Panacea domain-containing protein n=2 Tax=Effusibacillus consociatus TaxID=1117041 RepID=A0ABV9Q393_9BACL